MNFSTSAHPQTDGQSERVIQVLEDMLRACAMDFGDKWIDNLPYAEFSYNNSYQASIGMAPFEALYGRKCQTPLYWGSSESEQGNQGRVMDMEETASKVKLIQARLRAAQSRQKSYADQRRRELDFEVGDWVFLKLTPQRGIERHPRKGKLSPRYIGPFEILERVGAVTYRLDLPEGLTGMHNVFHVSQLRKYNPDPSHVLNDEPLQLHADLTYEEQPIRILDRSVKKLRNKDIPMVKILWKHHGIEDATWETEEFIQRKYPRLL